MWGGWWGGEAKKPANSVVARKAAEAQQMSYEERATKHQRSANMRLLMQHQELEATKKNAKACAAQGNLRIAKALLAKARALEQEIQAAEAKAKNAHAQTRAVVNAHSNLDQVLLMEAGATEMEEIAGALESVDVGATVERVTDAAVELEQYNHELTKPMFDDPVDDDQLDDDLNALMAEVADDRMAEHYMPDAPAPTTAKTKQPAAPIKQ